MSKLFGTTCICKVGDLVYEAYRLYMNNRWFMDTIKLTWTGI